MPSPQFRIVCEGPTDAAIIRPLLAGIFEDKRIVATRLPDAGSVASNPDDIGGWGNVLKYISSRQFEKAFDFAQYIIIHVDADKCKDFGVDVHDEGKRVSDIDIVRLVAEKLQTHIGDAWQRIGTNIIFAIAVDPTECWLLAHYGAHLRPVPTQQCFDKLGRLVAATKPSRISRFQKDRTLYEVLAKPLAKRGDLEKACANNQSLALFLEEVTRATHL